MDYTCAVCKESILPAQSKHHQVTRALATANRFFKARDIMNAEVHLAEPRWSPITVLVANAFKIMSADENGLSLTSDAMKGSDLFSVYVHKHCEYRLTEEAFKAKGADAEEEGGGEHAP